MCLTSVICLGVLFVLMCVVFVFFSFVFMHASAAMAARPTASVAPFLLFVVALVVCPKLFLSVLLFCYVSFLTICVSSI